MYEKRQRNKGYYRALKQNRKILNKRIRALDIERDLLSGQKNMYSKSTGALKNLIEAVKKAGFLTRLHFLFSGKVETLMAE